LVPTISILLGLPIPYSNIGGLVPSLLPSPNHSTEQSTPNIALSLALNAAQVWRYFTVYSQTANKLPSMPELESLLNSALSAYKRALEHEDVSDSIAYREACGKFKLFLKEAAELGIRVWTRFDSVGMVLGGSILFASALLVAWHLVRLALRLNSTLPGDQRLEVSLASVLMLFYCLLLTFSNSYINAEQHIGTFIQAVICIALCTRLVSAPAFPKNGRIMPAATPWLPLVIPLCHRTGELFVAGHGLDPSIPLHAAHHPGFFLSSLFILLLFRIYLHGKRSVPSIHVYLDVAVLLLVALAWVEKRSSDTARNGYIQCRISLFLLALSISQSVYDVSINGREGANFQRISDRVSILLFRLLAAIMAVTGPSSAASVVLFLVQALVLQRLAEQAGPLEVSICVGAF
jgi:phosphatidylinositol glycan class O